MEMKGVVKMEDVFRSPSSFFGHFPASNQLSTFSAMLDFSSQEEEKSSMGFMELLGFHDVAPSIYDVLQFSNNPSVERLAVSPPEITTDQALNQPTTPNSSSISSASSGAPNDEQSRTVDREEEELDQEQQKNIKQLKPKKTSLKIKGQREPRFAFMTKSEVDHLEDGYRWRKYGQKAVKNSPFPRGYYRCTSPSCNVKKRVERSFSDPSIVVTTYEGKHAHPSPVLAPRPHAAANSQLGLPPPGVAFPASVFPNLTGQFNNLPMYPIDSTPNVTLLGSHFCSPKSGLMPTDHHGLLEDIVPSLLIKEED